MKVNQTGVNSLQGKEAQAAQSTKKTDRAATQKNAKSQTALDRTYGADAATTKISDRAREMVFAKNLAKNAPANPEREAKIQELKERIARKEYNVKPDDVAERLIKEHRDTKEMG